MALFFSLFIFSMFHFTNNANYIPSPGYKPSLEVNSLPFLKAYKPRWGFDHLTLYDNGTLNIVLDEFYGGGFRSKHAYSSGYFGAQMKLPDNKYTAGIDISLYLSNNERRKKHDEIDIEFLGNITGEPYSLQTNVYIKGTGDLGEDKDWSKLIGRQMTFNLWFDPAKEFATYAIVYNPTEITWFVNDVPIRVYKKYSDATFPMRPMWAYGSIWDASDWATEGGKYRAKYDYQPFTAQYRDFKLMGCHHSKPVCVNAPAYPPGYTGLTDEQHDAMMYVQKHFMTYNYCHDKDRDKSQIPECAAIN